MLPQGLGRMRRFGIERKAAISHHQGGDALHRLFHPVRLTQADQVIMAMRIDKARREIAAIGVDNLRAIRAKRGFYFSNAASPDAKVGEKPGRAGAIDNAWATNEEMVGHAALDQMGTVSGSGMGSIGPRTNT